MATIAEDLVRIETALDQIATRCDTPKVRASLKRLTDVVERAHKSFCGSWLGYHSCVYYAGLNPPPPGAHFSSQWGLQELHISDTTGDWREFDGNQLMDKMREEAGSPTIDDVIAIATNAADESREYREELISILEACVSRKDDAYLQKLKGLAQEARVRTAKEAIEHYTPSGRFMSNDMVAISAGLKTPPHIQLQAQIEAIESCLGIPKALSTIAKRTSSHLGKKEQARGVASKQGNKVFIGHGGSESWRQLKDFLEDTLGLQVDEFNQKPVAGITNITRLSEMLDDAGIAFLIMTAEDEQKDGTKHARMNVIHEAGLFQGRLGFTRAIVILEEGCEEFSNIQGLGQIRFPSKKIKAAFQEIREVLEREGLI